MGQEAASSEQCAMAVADSERPLRVLEFYSGIGGLHYSLVASGASAEVVEAFDINEVANDVYEHNFHHRPSQGNIQRLTVAQLDKYRADVWLLSPPCQPYTRQGLQKDAADGRATSFLGMLDKLPAMKQPPDYMLLENVVGFEVSVTHKCLLACLASAGYVTQEFILSPLQFGIPYSRPRYFCLAKRQPLSFLHASLDGQLLHHPPLRQVAPLDPATSPPDIRPIREFLDASVERTGHEISSQPVCWYSSEAKQRATAVPSEAGLAQPQSTALASDTASLCSSREGNGSRGAYRLPQDIIERWGEAFDIVTPESTRCCCFTKSYVKYAKGTGSILATTPGAIWRDRLATDVKGIVNGGIAGLNIPVDELAQLLSQLGLRYFSPREVANLHSFPSSFSFPDQVSVRQRYALLGNSLSIKVVGQLLAYLLDNGP